MSHTCRFAEPDCEDNILLEESDGKVIIKEGTLYKLFERLTFQNMQVCVHTLTYMCICQIFVIFIAKVDITDIFDLTLL